MARTILPKGIASISGAIGALIYKTFTKPDGTKETRVYRNPYRTPGYQRSTPVTDNEVRSRSRFSLMNREVTRRINAGDRRPRKAIWADVKADFANNPEN